MIINALVEYLEDNAIGTANTDIFVGELPFDIADCISLLYVPSPEPNKSVPYYRQTIDIWARYTKFDDGYSKLQDIMDLLHRAENYEINGFHVYLSYARGAIDDLDRDSERRHLFRLSLDFVYREGESFS